ncbi:NAD(P)-binding protein [Gonapodya prolifera JEL478]|uniref:NAD(P)-binding protein n=1 Tax=Gonapodya prolifera (strain JEL478) TaxID=1344416 RepID=A0A139ACL6_GONPJ|nr:NAD(P)-binding protein [Gonapodya prolifera JEL478]|eukprot:KXS14551.1 NAD(P)-binding protein [Gonapodya prolifera JEL478]
MTKTAIVTGAHGAFGKWIARNLWELDWDVFLVCRQKAQCVETVNWIKESAKKSGAGELDYIECDLGSYKDIKAMSTKFVAEGRKLHALVNNAATTPRTRTVTSEGLEAQFAVNIMAYYWLTKFLWPALVSTGTEADPARVVNVASGYAGGLDLTDMQFKRRAYDNNSAYRASKQAERMMTGSFAEKMSECQKGTVWISSCYPAWAPSKLSADLGTPGPDSEASGADTPVWCAVEGSLTNANNFHKTLGGYASKKAMRADEYQQDRKGMETLWKECERVTGLLEKTGRADL